MENGSPKPMSNEKTVPRMFQVFMWEGIKVQVVGTDQAKGMNKCRILWGDGKDFRTGSWVYLENNELRNPL